jgi:hypothetical protein
MDEWGLDDNSREGTPAAILLNNGSLKDIDIRNVMVTSELKPGDKVTGSGVAGVRLAADAQVQSINVSDLTIVGYETGVIIEDGARGEDLRFDNLTMRDVGTPWVISGSNLVQGNIKVNWR